jgi:mono/diheme cytochrome c family protein
MSIAESLPKFVVLAVLAAGVGIFAWQLVKPSGTSRPYTANVTEPALSAAAVTGKSLFEANCAGCHGLKAAGTDKGPPLIHDIYNPGHHSDGAFFLAAKLGVRQHHWPYGDMPPQRQLTEEQTTAIVQYVRELQIANGIRYRPHRM